MNRESLFYIPCLCGAEIRSHERETQCPQCGLLLVAEWGNDPVEIDARRDREYNGLPPLEAEKARAAFYGLYLRRVAGLDADEAASLVAERYPRVRPFLARLLRPRQAHAGLNEISQSKGEYAQNKIT